MGRIGLGLLLAVVIAGCGGGGTRHTSAPPALPTAVDGCDGAGPGWRRFDVHAPDGLLTGAISGRGDVGVVLANESGNRTCPWVPFAADLSRAGRRVVVFEYFDSGSAANELLAEARALEDSGARRVAIVGASLGGRAVVQAAARGGSAIDAAVSLSAERTVGTLPEILPDARRVRVPSLYVGSREDGYTTFGRDTRQLYRATPAASRRLVLVSGGDHGVDLLAKPQVRRAIDAFIAAHAG